jgi:hypothetical protein
VVVAADRAGRGIMASSTIVPRRAETAADWPKEGMLKSSDTSYDHGPGRENGRVYFDGRLPNVDLWIRTGR